jgi:hypothetical protein
VGFAYLPILVLNTMLGGAPVLLMMSCQIAAFARDGGLVFHDKLACVSPYNNMPIYSSMAVTFGGILMLCLGFSSIASNTIYSLSVIAITVLYITPVISCIFDGGRWNLRPRNLGKFNITIHAWSVLSVTYMTIMECFPPSAAWEGVTLNYNWAVLIVVTLI